MLELLTEDLGTINQSINQKIEHWGTRVEEIVGALLLDFYIPTEEGVFKGQFELLEELTILPGNINEYAFVSEMGVVSEWNVGGMEWESTSKRYFSKSLEEAGHAATCVDRLIEKIRRSRQAHTKYFYDNMEIMTGIFYLCTRVDAVVDNTVYVHEDYTDLQTQGELLWKTMEGLRKAQDKNPLN